MKIKLDYATAIGIANSMKNNAVSFEANHQNLLKAVSELSSIWSGNISSVMQSELKDMNNDVGKIQESLAGLADLAASSADLLKETDSAIGTGINAATN